MNALIVIFGAGLGGGVRHGINLAVARLAPALGFPLATLLINVAGSFLMGVLAAAFALRGEAPQSLRLFLTTGILGGFTTFSTFSLDAITLWQRGETGAAAFYVAASVGLGLAGLVAGLALTRALLPVP
ncbi:putative fluoride ion transporter CrcB [Methylobacterium gregans]|uniref:Fluoride-specific ion channel FluC n=1 Tax=Methylobacterium gregans TaxID=374424 RepID=A0AA37MCZ5_9HYPH|nr:fluoride efflux transporter CrcB [Methylobacterium gregans]MDQ0520157.1 CrcB protein [Methylobacterium gregans]GJD80448.1 Putative fluoride ion transporter CrcB [Methylobacterium gregans]GLS52560.1 putative fluoride ion transporter CrcB [Methylobacterium gregans]